ncbi:hypothetical protein EXIGLDRAFT_759572 [Exidia glandulosa HHB12029]|uniref:Clathrin/coatomer adaptor adaptin-like N-terminal domain-containing protein n=1 Tax=Exidia glandulosa HHB12029 TaxID=1314781 RepID=A0A166BNZ1_EXIGL|nr:hypothetical protein EXIGLDRAFT_759572 [Exidia glandulosa HHB12029]
MSALDTLQKNATRLTARIQETLSESTRGTFSNGPSLDTLDASDDKLPQLRKQLDSRADGDKLDAMRRLIAAVSKGRNVSAFFPDVVKNVVSQNLEIRKLVYIFLIRYAESEPDLALLSVNTFQKDLADPNPLIRAMALRVLSSIRVPMIASIVALAIKKAAADTSPYVRKAAALAIPKCFSLDASQQSALLAILTQMLADRSPLAVGSVATAFNALCPDRLDLLHPHFRRLARLVVDVDEWGQIVLLDLLSRYARTMLARPPPDESGAMDPDLQLLLTSAEPLLASRNPAVVLAASRTFYYIAPPFTVYLTKPITPLIRLLHMSPEVAAVVCADLGVIAREHPQLLTAHIHRFFIRSDDLPAAALEKLRILSAIVDAAPEHSPAFLRELEHYTRSPDERIVRGAVQAVGRVASMVPECTMQCVALLLRFIQDAYTPLVSSAILALKTLVQTQKAKDVVPRLAERLPDIRDPRARACVVWLVGQYDDPSSSSRDFAPDVLRLVARGYATEAPQTKLAALTLAAKLIVRDGEVHPAIPPLAAYVFALARCDTDVDVRDRGRMLGALVERAGLIPSSAKPKQNAAVDEDAWRSGGAAGTDTQDGQEDEGPIGVVLRVEQVRVILRSGKSVPGELPLWPEDLSSDNAVLGSLALALGRSMGSSRRYPEWPDEGTDGALRDVPEERPVTPLGFIPSAARGFGNTNAGPSSPLPQIQTGTSTPVESQGRQGPWRNLDDFYADANDASEEEEDEEEEEEESGEGEEDGESTEEDDVDAGPGAPLVSRTSAVEDSSEGEYEEESEDSGEDDHPRHHR